MVWTYHEVEQLRKKKQKGEEEISISEIRSLEKYIKIKKQVADKAVGSWSGKQLLRAEELLHEIKNSKETVKVQTR